MKLRKAASILLATATVGCMLLTGCGNAGSADSSKDATSKSAEKIIIFQSKVEIVDQLEALAKDYKEETGVEVEVWSTTGDDYFQQLKTKLANNQGPTVFSLGPGAESEQMLSYLADLGDVSFVDKIAEGMTDEKDGKVVGIPYTLEGFGLVYDKDLYDPAKYTDVDSFISYLEEQKAAGVNGLGLSSESYFMIGHILNTPFALQEDADGFVEKLAAGEVKMADTPEFQEFAKLYAAIRDNCANPLEQNYDKEIGDFATGKSATIHQGNWAASMFKDYDMEFDYGLAPLPIGGNDSLTIFVPTAWYVNSQASEEEQAAGKEFLEWLYTSETGTSYLMDEFGFLPVVDGVENESMDKLSADVAAYAADGKYLGAPMNNWPAGIVDVYLVPVAEEFFTTDMSPEEFLQRLDEVWAKACE